MSLLRLSFWSSFLAVSLVVVLISLNGVQQVSQEIDISEMSAQESTVLGYKNQYVRINNGKTSWGSHDVISQSMRDAAQFGVMGQVDSGEGTVKIYKARMEQLLRFMAYTEEGKRVHEMDMTGTELLAEKPVVLQESTSVVDMPTDAEGVYLIELRSGEMYEYAYVIRSSFGSIVKEGDDLMVFWVQSFENLQRIAQAGVAVYQLNGGVSLLYTAETGSDGIANMPLSSQADVAVVTVNGEVALVPLNLRYSGYDNYDFFRPDDPSYRMFSFTDRPLYRRGDTVYYKSIIRADKDAEYSIPVGTATVELFEAYGGSEDAIVTQHVSIDGDGGIDGQMTIPADGELGWYRLQITMPDGVTPYFWGAFGGQSSSVSFQVEEFRKPEYSMDLRIDGQMYTAGDRVSMVASVDYFSGGPVQTGSVSMKVFRADYYDYNYFRPERMLSDDYRYGYWGGSLIGESKFALDDTGQAALDYVIKPLETISGPLVYTFEVEYADGSGNPVFERKNVLVWPAAYMVYQSEGWHYWHGNAVGETVEVPFVVVTRTGDEVAEVDLNVDIVHKKWVRNPEGVKPSYRTETQTLPSQKIITGADGLARLSFVPSEAGRYEMKVVGKDSVGNMFGREFSIYVSDATAGWWYEDAEPGGVSIASDKEVYDPSETARLVVSSELANRDVLLSFDREHMRRFQVLRIEGTSAEVPIELQQTDMPNVYASVVGFTDKTFVSAMKELTISAEQQRITMSVEADQAEYGPGDTVTLDISTVNDQGEPVSAETTIWAVDKALFELADERLGDIFEQFWQARYNDTRVAHSLQGISDYGAEMGGCFVGETEVSMADGSRKQIAEVTVGERVLTRVSADDPRLVSGEVTAVHEHEADGYLILNGRLRVTPEHVLWVNQSWQTAGDIQVGDYLLTQDGEHEEVWSVEWVGRAVRVFNLTIADYSSYMADGVWVHNDKGGADRTVFKDTAYWNASVRTDSNGKATVRFQLPDNLTTWVVSGVAANQQTQVGQARTEVRVTQGIILRPFLPNILRYGDAAILQAQIHNNTASDLVMEAWMEHDNLAIENQVQEGLQVSANSTRIVSWQVKPESVASDGELRVGVEATNGEGDSLAVPLPILRAGIMERYASSGLGSREYHWEVADDTDWTQSEAKLSLSSSMVGSVIPAMEYLIEYPYGCVEQTTSRLVPVLLAVGNESVFGDALEDTDLDAMVDSGLERLMALQKSDGSWSWWYGETDLFITVYVLDSLEMAVDKGYEVDSEMLSRAQRFVLQYMERETNNRTPDAETLALLAYAHSVVSPDESYQMVPVDEKIGVDLAALAVMANVDHGYTDSATNGAEVLRGLAHQAETGVYWDAASSGRFGSIDATTALAARALLMVNPDDQLVDEAMRYLSTSRVRDYWSNTFATVQVMRVMLTYYQQSEESQPNFRYEIWNDETMITSGQVSEQWQDTIDVSEYGKTGKLEVRFDGEGKLYSSMVADQWRTKADLPAVVDGLQIDRIIENETEPGKSLMVGDVAKVTLQVANLTGDDQNYVLIQDQLPAGLIPVNTHLNNEQQQVESSRGWWSATQWDFYPDRVNGYKYEIQSDRPLRVTYMVRVVSEGTYTWPPAHAELMYVPEYTARTSYATVTVGDERVDVPRPELPRIVNQKSAMTDVPQHWTDFDRSQWPWWLRLLVVIGLGGVSWSGYRFYRRWSDRRHHKIDSEMSSQE